MANILAVEDNAANRTLVVFLYQSFLATIASELTPA